MVKDASNVEGAAEKWAVVPCGMVPVSMVVKRQKVQEIHQTIMTERRKKLKTFIDTHVTAA